MMDTIKRSSLANGLVNRLNAQRYPGRDVAFFARLSVHAQTTWHATNMLDALPGYFRFGVA